MRFRRTDLRRRVKGHLNLRYEAQGLTSFAGLELVRRYLQQIELAAQLRRHLGRTGLENDYGLVGMVFVVLGLLITGGRRLHHLLFQQDDVVFRRFCGLKRLPSPGTVGRWLRRFTQAHIAGLLRVNEAVVAEGLRRSGLRRFTIDVDGSVVSTGQQVEWAFRGFNPHHRKVPSYYPITAYEAQTGVILRTKNRPGNVHDGKASLGFLRDVLDQLHRTVRKGSILEFRMDGAFFRQDVLSWLDVHGLEYAIRAPFFHWIGLKELVRRRRRWKRVAPGVDCFEKSVFLEPWNRKVRVVLYRKKVYHRTRKNFQLDLFDPSDGYFEYSAIATNKKLNGKNLWWFLNGRGSHERAYAELKNGFAFDTVPTAHYGANTAWQVLSVMAFNLMNGFQVATGATSRRSTRKRSTVYLLESIRTLRYKWLNRAGLLVSPQGQPTLDVGRTADVKRRFTRLAQRLPRAA